ncbi:hypothetical protein M426DRAFT_317639 [Hypoxylon sp. CI-4A]|nr:hypothetical protein M426DRAFT_317639 [Hypoxylon sp. CI-4A]
MPPRKRNAAGAANKPAEPTRRSARTAKKATPIIAHSSDDEPSPQPSTSRRSSLKSAQDGSKTQLEETSSNVITVRTTRAKSYTSSRPSTAHSDAASAPRVVSTPVTKGDMKMIDVDDAGDEEDELAIEEPVPKKAKPTPGSARKGKSKYDNPDEMLTNPRAPLATARLRELLCSSKAWDVLSTEEKQQVLAKFPDDREVLNAGTGDARPDTAALRNNDNFRHDVARYQEDLRKGWHDPEWIEQARAAHRQRDVGYYNEYLSARFEEDWGMPLPGEESSDSGSGSGSGADAAKESGGESSDVKDSKKEDDVQEEEGEKSGSEIKVLHDPESNTTPEDGGIQDPDAMEGVEPSAPEESNGNSPSKEATTEKENGISKDIQEDHPDTKMAEDEQSQ